MEAIGRPGFDYPKPPPRPQLEPGIARGVRLIRGARPQSLLRSEKQQRSRGNEIPHGQVAIANVDSWLAEEELTIKVQPRERTRGEQSPAIYAAAPDSIRLREPVKVECLARHRSGAVARILTRIIALIVVLKRRAAL